jgi:TonB family protein
MKRTLLPVLALSLLLGACSSATRTSSRLPISPPPVRTADRASAWGERPSYDRKGQYFAITGKNGVQTQLVSSERKNVIGEVELLVERDGTVKDAVIVSSSGNADFDRSFVRLCRNAQYSLRLDQDAPAPYVVRQPIAIKYIVSMHHRTIGIDVSDYSQSGPQPNFTGDVGGSHSQMFSPPAGISYSTQSP